VPTSADHVPKHRAAGAHKREREGGRSWRRVLALSGAAAVSTGLAVATGVLADSPDVLAADAGQSRLGASGAEAVEGRLASRDVVSRSDRRGDRDPVKEALLSTGSGLVSSRSQQLDDSDPRDVARALLPEFGFDSGEEFMCLDALYVSESDWRIDADNPSSSAYGIPQALTQLHDLPEGYMTSAEVQIRWGLGYIARRYGTPCAAWRFKAAHNWY
jgi:hypothetical protein